MSEEEIGVDVVIEDEEGSVEIKSDVLKGDKGEKGDPTATIEINQVITGEAGTNAKIENVGTDVNLKLDITIPQGDKGEQGETGADGYTPIKGTDYFTESEIQQIKSDILADVSSFDLEVVTTLPTENIKEKTIYLVPNSKQAENNIYDEYIYINNNWEIVGSTAIDPENLKDSVPIGAIIEYEGDTVPDGYEEVEDEGEVYSTSEVRIGTWIDGKPLYRKVVVYKNTEIIGTKGKIVDFGINHNISNFKQLCKLDCTLSTGNILPVSIGSTDGTNIDFGTRIYQVDSKQINLRLINDTWGPREWYITLEYTKTTD